MLFFEVKGQGKVVISGLRFLMLCFIAFIIYYPMVSADLTSLTVQGKLANNSGDVLSGTYSLTFNLYSVAVGGSSLWSQVSNITADARGVYTVELSDIDLDFDIPYYLGVEVESDGEMTPRYNLTASPYSFSASGLNSSIELNKNLSFDSNTLFIDSTNNLVGIGTNNPSQKLDVIGSINVSTGKIYTPEICLNGDCQTIWPAGSGGDVSAGWDNSTGEILASQNVSVDSGVLFVDTTNDRIGIGKTVPEGIFEIRAGLAAPVSSTFTTTASVSNIILGRSNTGTKLMAGVGASAYTWLQAQSSSDNTFRILAINPSGGNVGIGTESPSEKLEISDGSKGLTVDPTATNPTVNTTGNSNVTITSSGGSVIIQLG